MAQKVFACVFFSIFVSFYAEARIVDLTYRLANQGMSYWPGHTKYHLTPDLRGPFGVVEWVASNQFKTSEHMGSHIDAPYHFKETGRKVHEISLDELRGPAVVVNIKEKAKRNRNAEVAIQDLLDWEAKYGRIPDKAYIIMKSGFGQYWGNHLKYLGSKAGNSRIDKLSWPGFSLEATQWLLKERNSFRGLASDSMSCERGNTTVFPVHVKLLYADKFCVENVANIDEIPEQGAQLYAMPILIEGGTGAPLRLFALVDEGMPLTQRGTMLNCKWHIVVWVILFFVLHQL